MLTSFLYCVKVDLFKIRGIRYLIDHHLVKLTKMKKDLIIQHKIKRELNYPSFI